MKIGIDDDRFAKCPEHLIGDARADCLGCAYALLLRDKQAEWKRRKDSLAERLHMATSLKGLLEAGGLSGLVVTEDGDITMPLAVVSGIGRMIMMKLEIGKEVVK